MKRIEAPLSKHLSVPRDRSNPKLVAVEEDIIVHGSPRTMRCVREIVKRFKIILVFDHHTRNATTNRNLRRRRVHVKGIWCRVEIILKMVRGGFAFLAIVLLEAVLSKKRTKTKLCQQCIPQAGLGGTRPIELSSRPRRRRLEAWFQTSGEFKVDLPVRLRLGVKENFFFTVLRARSRPDLGNQRRCEWDPTIGDAPTAGGGTAVGAQAYAVFVGMERL